MQAFRVPASLRNTDVPLIIRGAAPIGHDKLAGAMKIWPLVQTVAEG